MTPVDAFVFLHQLDLVGFLALFWYLVVFDFSRYTVSVVAMMAELVLPKREAPPYRGPVSVLLVGHDEGEGLEASIRSLEEQTHEHLQIVVVDDGSGDDMAAVARRLNRQSRIDTFASTGLRGGKASALNLGLRYCKHPIVVTCEIDTSFDRDAIARLVARFGDERVGAVAGNLGVRNARASTIAMLQAIQYIISISLGRRFTSMMGWLLIVSGAFGAYRREAIDTVGGWDVGPGDDSNLTTKVRRSGWSVSFAHDAWALTDVPTKTGALVRQQLRWNRSIIRNRLRKFRSVFHPLDANFSFQDALAATNILFFQVVLSLSFFAYLSWLVVFYPSIAPLAILTVTLIYILEDIFILGVAAFFYHERVTPRMLLYSPFSTFFKSYFLRSIRAAACLDEMTFRRSYRDSFYPTKVRDNVEQF